MVLGKPTVPGRPTIWITVGHGLTALAVGAGGGCLDILTLIYPFSPLSPSLWEMARYRLKYCLKGPLNPKPTNQPNIRILAKAVLQIFCSQCYSYTKCLCPKKESNSTKNLRNRFKSYQFIYTLVCTYMPNIRILAKALLQIFCSQGCSCTKCQCP